jgi:NADPH:quinone reductase-like Zn-dependent oxidoreductase
MKAVVVKAFGEANFFDVDDYAVPEPNEESVTVRIKSAAFNPVDYKIRKGNTYILVITKSQSSC